MEGRKPAGITMALLPLLLVYILYAWDRLAIPVELVEISKAYSLSAQTASALASIFTLGIAIFLLIGGALVTRIGERVCLVGGVALFSISTAYTAFGFGAADLIVARIFTGVGEAVFSICLLLFLSRLSETRKGMAIGLSPSIFGLATIAGAPAVAFTRNLAGNWYAIFVGLGVAGLLLCVPLWLLGTADNRTSSQTRPMTLSQSIRQSVSRGTGRLYLIMVVAGIGIYSVLSMIVSFERTVNHTGFVAASGLLSFIGLGGILGGVPAGALGDRFGRPRVLAIGALCNAISGTLLFSTAYSSVGHAVLCLAFGTGAGAIYVNAIALGETAVPAAAAPMATGLLLTVYYGAAAISGPLFVSITGSMGWLYGSLLLFGATYLAAAVAASGLQERR